MYMDTQFPPLQMPNLPFLKLSFILNVPVLTGALIIFFIGYVILTSVLMYHWSAYGMRHQGVLIARTLFLLVSAVLFIIALLALSYF